jgi:hypothetical protein
MRPITVALLVLCLAACETRAGRDFNQAKQAYIECVNAKGAAACEGQRAVMDATAGIYATASGRQQAPSPAVTLGVYQ